VIKKKFNITNQEFQIHQIKTTLVPQQNLHSTMFVLPVL
jgi:hypothetical protein